MASPYLVAAVSMSTLIALAAISTTSSNQMNWSLAAQQAMNIQADKASENISLVIKNNTLDVKNNMMKASVLQEFRIMDGGGNMLGKIDYSSGGGYILGAFGSIKMYPVNFSQLDFVDKKIIAVTDLGNVFSSLTQNEITESEGGGKAMINGMGINSRIIQVEPTGKLNYGQGMVGRQESLEPYKTVPSTTNFAAEILENEPSITLSIPRFNTKFRYDNMTQTLQDIGGTTPNILGYSQSRTVGGAATTTVVDGIVISGTGTTILKLNDYQNTDLVLEGTVPSGASLYVGTGPQYNYLGIPYHSTYGYQVWSGSLPSPTYSQNGCTYANGAGYNCHASWTYTRTFSPSLVVSSQTNYNSYYATWPFTIQSGVQNPTTYSINSIRMVAGASSGWGSCGSCYPTISPVPSGYTHFVYDKEIVMQNKIDLSGSFQTTFAFEQAKQYYVVAKPNGGTLFIRGSAFDPQTTPMLQIENLPANIPFQIEKNGKVAVSGMINYDGRIIVYASEFTVNDVSAGGVLRIYPSALAYRGPFSTVVFDNLNHRTIHIPTPEDRVYVVHAYVSIPVVGEIQVTDVYLDSQLELDYLEGNYTTGNKIRIPVIPGYHDINMKINGVPTTTVIANVLGGGGLKVVEPNSSTITNYAEDQTISSISSTVGSVSYVIATTEGTMTASITATISGDSEIQNYAHFGAPPPPPPPPPPRDPLKAYVDVYKNGILVKQQQIYFNSNPIMQNTGQVLGTVSSMTAKYVYPQTVINGIITTTVFPGDMVEFYLYANIQADGSVPPIPSGSVFYHYSGQGHATATIHGGSILAS
ncbi:MAG TPA: hypothetical protein VNL34_02860 [Candidatus Nitrosotenuis sp.]|nr:hypothetical protein [Candidatus Nitrosotenuis sp.]